MISFQMTPFRFGDAVWLHHNGFLTLKPLHAEQPPERLFRPAPTGFGDRLMAVQSAAPCEGEAGGMKHPLNGGSDLLRVVRFGPAIVEERFAGAVEALHGPNVQWMSSTWWGDVFALKDGAVVAIVESLPPKGIGRA